LSYDQKRIRLSVRDDGRGIDAKAPGVLTYSVTFNRAMQTSNLDATDFTLHGNFAGCHAAAWPGRRQCPASEIPPAAPNS
jgi:hypothetical protein